MSPIIFQQHLAIAFSTPAISSSSSSASSPSNSGKVPAEMGSILLVLPIILISSFWLYKRQRIARYQRQVAALERLWALKCDRIP